LLLSTLLSGALDASAGVVVYDLVLGRMSIVQILQWIGSGVFGPRAFSMGLRGAAWGVVFHFIIAFGFSAGLFALYRTVAVLRSHPVTSGLIYGAIIWAVMNFVVIPNSHTVTRPFELGVALTALVWHMTLVGLPIVLVARRTLRSFPYATPTR
jgi:uncharacterized membrane protein YagU involved in acid resistance